jgi:hypothetical protein
LLGMHFPTSPEEGVAYVVPQTNAVRPLARPNFGFVRLLLHTVNSAPIFRLTNKPGTLEKWRRKLCTYVQDLIER